MCLETVLIFKKASHESIMEIPVLSSLLARNRIQKATEKAPLHGDERSLRQALLEARFRERDINIHRIKELTASLDALRGNAIFEVSHLKSEKRIMRLVEIVEEIVARFDSAFMPRTPEMRSQACGYYSTIVAVVAENMDMDARIFQLYDVNELRNVGIRDSYGHAFTIVEDKDGEIYLVDLTRVQFDKKDGGMVDFAPNAELENNQHNTGNISDFPTISLLNRDGYVRLTDLSLNQYLDAATKPELFRSFLTVDDLRKATPLVLNNSRSEILEYLKLVK